MTDDCATSAGSSSTMPELRHSRGAERVRRLGADSTDAASIVRAALVAASVEVPVQVARGPSVARPAARGRYLAGVITLFPAAFADPLTLAWTVLHEAGHALGLDERRADAFAAAHLEFTG